MLQKNEKICFVLLWGPPFVGAPVRPNMPKSASVCKSARLSLGFTKSGQMDRGSVCARGLGDPRHIDGGRDSPMASGAELHVAFAKLSWPHCFVSRPATMWGPAIVIVCVVHLSVTCKYLGK